jgi:catechol 2,3-dioxygenase-like lactoylglutathione lyase family enzyme
MIGYTTFGTNNYEKALDFYDKLLGEVGGKRVMDVGKLVLFGFAQGPMFGVAQPHNGQPATPGNGTMISFNAGAKEKVDIIHAKALSLGGSCEGRPGDRGGGFYGAYFRDLDGNKMCAFVMA